MSKLPNPPSFVHHNEAQFLIMDAPTNHNLPLYIKELKDKGIGVVVRTCEPTYSQEPLQKNHIRLCELSFPDGQPPNDDIITKWLKLVELENKKNSRPVAVHCVAGLGRAPVLVAIALIEIGMDPIDAITLIRKARRGAINQKQYNWLRNYQVKRKEQCCLIL